MIGLAQSFHNLSYFALFVAFLFDGSSLHSIIGITVTEPLQKVSSLMVCGVFFKLQPMTTVPQCCLISLHDWLLNITLV